MQLGWRFSHPQKRSKVSVAPDWTVRDMGRGV
jgi:hypothetical protein